MNIIGLIPVLFLVALPLWADRGDTPPSSPYDLYTALTVFWILIAGLVIILKMKLKAIEDEQSTGLKDDNNDSPSLSSR